MQELLFGIIAMYVGPLVVAGALLLVLAWATADALAQPRKRRRAAGLCERCGYELRATPERCPRWGTVAARAALNVAARG